MKSTRVLLTCFLFLATAVVASAETFTGSVIDHQTRRTTARFTLEITEFSDVSVVERLVAILGESGPDALEDELRTLDAGWIRIGPNIGYPVSLARTLETEEGRIVRAVIDRPIQMVEVMRSLRSKDHPYGMIELRLDENGKGEGTLMAAAKILFNKDGNVEIEHMGAIPYRLLGVNRRANDE